MSLSHKVYDFPPIWRGKQLFHAGGQAFEGGFTSGGARVLTPEPGGRGILNMEFTVQRNAPADPIVSWLCSMIANGNIFRIPISFTPQLVKIADLGISATLEQSGIPWAPAGMTPEGPWDNGQNWAGDVLAEVAGTALAGTVTLDLDFGSLPLALRHGHLIGHDDVTYLVEDIEYDGTVATITVNPPLRNTVAQGDLITFRPKMLAIARNPDSFRGLYEPADIIRLGSVEFVEALI